MKEKLLELLVFIFVPSLLCEDYSVNANIN